MAVLVVNKEPIIAHASEPELRLGPDGVSLSCFHSECRLAPRETLTDRRMTKRLWSQISMSRPFFICIAVATTSLSSAHSTFLRWPSEMAVFTDRANSITNHHKTLVLDAVVQVL